MELFIVISGSYEIWSLCFVIIPGKLFLGKILVLDWIDLLINSLNDFIYTDTVYQK